MGTLALLLSLSLAPSLSFSRIDIEDGLSQNTVLSICQDKEGYMWFGTANGVNRYDGYELKVFHYDEEDDRTLLDNLVNKVFTGEDGTVWVCSAKGLSSFDRSSEHFSRYPFTSNISALGITQVAPDKILVATSTDPLLLDTESGKWTTRGIPAEISRSLCLSRIEDKILISTKRFTFCECRFESDSLIVQRLYDIGASALDVVQDRRGRYWIATEGGGLLHLDPESGDIRRYTVDDGMLPSNYVRSLAYDMEGKLWIGTANNLVILDEPTGEFFTVNSDWLDKNSPSHRSIKAICSDSQGGMWLGTYYGGVNYYHPGHIRFRSIRRSPEGTPIGDNIVSCILEDADGSLWIGTNQNGVEHYYPSSGTTDHYPLSDIPGLVSNDVKCFFRDPDGRHIWVGSHGSGLICIDKLTHRARHIESGVSNIYSITDAGNGCLWLGALGALCLYDRKTDSISRVLRSYNGRYMHILAMLRDASGALWLGTKEGIRVLDVGPDLSLKDITDPKLDRVYQTYSFHESPDMSVWIGTIDGLFKYDRKTGLLSVFTTADGLPDNAIRAIGEDSFGRLWLSTDKGLCSFNPQEKICRNYSEKDGLPSRQFIQGAYCRGADGRMYFGTVEGIAWFTPETIPVNRYSPSPVITELRVFDKRVPLDKGGRRLTLKHDQKSFTIRFATLNFIAGQHNTYAWKLEGYDKDWIVSPERSVTYSNLRKGRYRFLVKAANNDGLWNDTPVTLEIRVRPAWWQSTFFEAILLLLIVAAAGFAVKKVLDRQKQHSRREIHMMQEAHEKEMGEMRALVFAGDNIKITPAGREFLTKVIDTVEANISDPEFNVEKLASAMNTSRMNLHIKLKELTGKSSLELIRKIRFDKAIKLLDEGLLTISQIADKTGFGSSSWFTTSFKNYMGETPSEYLKRKK